MKIKVDISKEIKGFTNLKRLSIKNYLKKIIELEYCSSSNKTVYVSLLFTDNEHIKKINFEYRNKDSVTDVISFAFKETEDFVSGYDMLGEIIISLERIKEQAEEYNNSFEREFYYILTHGVLHLLGYDHIHEKDQVKMRKREEELLALISLNKERAS